MRDEWRRLFQETQTNNIFLSWEWTYLWCKHFPEKRKQLLVLLIKDNNKRTIGIAPLMKVDEGLLNRPIIKFLGDEMMADYMDFLISDNNTIEPILRFLYRKGDWARIELKRIPEYSETFLAIKTFLVNSTIPWSIEVDCTSPFIDIEGDWNEYYNSLSKSLKQDIRTTVNKLGRSGKIQYENLNEDNIKQGLESLFEMHKRRQENKVGISIFESERNQAFFIDVATTFLRLQWTDISVLKLNGKIISAVFALKIKDVFYYWIPSFDPDYIKYSLGKLSIYMLLQQCFKLGYKRFDFMIGDEEYKLRWTNRRFNNYCIKIFKTKFGKQLEGFRLDTKRYLRSIKNASPELKRIWVKLSKGKIFRND